ncbi:MAG TPA: UDP-N-acetylmuramate dehydrogenase [Bryobacteraceae bacterium]|nr:UDP-N-acetylmuramate dehydrogenase [Bryobacteraceae bacterium]
MPTTQSALDALAALPAMDSLPYAPLSKYTRFGIGGPARLLCNCPGEAVLLQALTIARESGLPHVVLGQGTNVIAADHGFPGVVLRYTAGSIEADGTCLTVDAGAVLQQLVDFSIAQGLEGLHTMTGIPGWVGAAIYGNAGAYGHSIAEFVRRVRFYDGLQVRAFDNSQCEFAYRESIFKRHKDWVILSATLELPRGDRQALQAKASEILELRNAKYPPAMKCAGSIFKNLLVRDLAGAALAQVPPSVIREGKIPSAWFLEQAGAKGMRRGDIQVAAYHANLIYNDGAGMAADARAVIAELKQRVVDRFALELEEEVQYVGFE